MTVGLEPTLTDVVYNNRPTFTKNPCLLFLLMLSRGAGVPFPVTYPYQKNHSNHIGS